MILWGKGGTTAFCSGSVCICKILVLSLFILVKGPINDNATNGRNTPC